jgi:hypothetical protein
MKNKAIVKMFRGHPFLVIEDEKQNEIAVCMMEDYQAIILARNLLNAVVGEKIDLPR